MVLHLTAKIGQSIDFPGIGRINVLEKSGRCVKLSIDFKPDQKVQLLPQGAAASTQPE